jgi:flagellar motor component MotA
MKKMYVVYLAIVLGICIGGVLISGGSLILFWDVPSFIFTPGIAFLIMLGHYSPREMVEAFKCAGTAERSEAELKKSLLFFETFHRITIISGFFAFMLGLVMLLVSKDLINETKAGPWMAVAILTVLYALFFVMAITVPFQSAIRKKMIR